MNGRHPIYYLFAALLLVTCHALPAAAEPEPADPATDALDGQLLEGLDDQLLEGLQESKSKDGQAPAASGTKETTPEPQPAKRQTDALDDELLRGLGGDLLDELDDNKAMNRQQPAEPTGEGQSGRGPLDALDEELLRGLGGEDLGESGEDDADPLVRLGRQMREVENRIRQTRSDQTTQEMQQQIVRDLDKLIEQIQKQQQQQQQSSSSSQQQTAERQRVQQPQTGQQQGQQQQKNNQASRDSSEQLSSRQAERPSPEEMQALIKNVWGELPERLRQQMMQSSMEEFLPKYELLIEQYFRTLSERQQEQR